MLSNPWHCQGSPCPRESVLTLISSLVMSKLDYCNVAFAGLPRCELDLLQSVINAAARLTVGAQLHDHITPLLTDLHWLQIPQHIQYSVLCVLVFIACMGLHRDIYKRLSVRSRTLSHDVACALPPRQTWPCRLRDALHWATAPLPWPVYVLGTLCLLRSGGAHHLTILLTAL